jgi:putative redox protein
VKISVDKIKLTFTNAFEGRAAGPNGEVLIGSQPGSMKPYHLLFGALGSCFYATFLSIAEKKRLTFSGAVIEIDGEKREESPATLRQVTIDVTIINPSDEKQFMRSVELGAKHCSIHETVSKVANIDFRVNFVYTRK